MKATKIFCALLAVFLGSAAVATVSTKSQVQNAADGPWAGWAQCVLRTTATNYEETQIHTWRITGGPPRVTGSARHWPAVWTVQGNGSRPMPISVNKPAAVPISAPAAAQTETWTYNVPPTDAAVAIWEVPVGQLRIGSQHAQLIARGGLEVKSGTEVTTPPGSLGEWQFPYVTGRTSDTSIKTAAPAERSLTLAIAWQRPHNTPTVESCSWEFVKGGPASDPPGFGSTTGGNTGRIEVPVPGEVLVPGSGRGQQQVTPGTGRSGAPGTSAPPSGTPTTTTPPPSTPTTTTPPPSTTSAPPPTAPPPPQNTAPPPIATQPPQPTVTPVPPSAPPPPTPTAVTPTTGTTGTLKPIVPLTTTTPTSTTTTTATTTPTSTTTTSPPPPPSTGGRGGVLLPATTTTTSGTSSTAVRTGTYLVTINGVICGQPTKDSPFPGVDPDGKGDEIYAAAYVRRFDRTSFELRELTVRQTIPYGDISNYGTSRLQGGTQTPTGGVQSGDAVPGTLNIARVYPAQESAFPFRVWQGQLTDAADALLISPMIWEHDGGSSIFQQWVQSQGVLNNTIFMDPAVQTRVGSRMFGTLETGVIDPATPDLLSQIINGRQDGPVGVRLVDRTYVIPNITVVLTREIIEQALSSQWAKALPTVVPGQLLTIPKPGILVVNFATTGSPNVPTSYTLILQVEKIG